MYFLKDTEKIGYHIFYPFFDLNVNFLFFIQWFGIIIENWKRELPNYILCLKMKMKMVPKKYNNLA